MKLGIANCPSLLKIIRKFDLSYYHSKRQVKIKILILSEFQKGKGWIKTDSNWCDGQLYEEGWWVQIFALV